MKISIRQRTDTPAGHTLVVQLLTSTCTFENIKFVVEVTLRTFAFRKFRLSATGEDYTLYLDLNFVFVFVIKQFDNGLAT